MTRKWSHRLLQLNGIVLRSVGFPSPNAHRVTLVANHVSWIDIFALNAETPCHFIAKSELRQWPIVGRLLTNVGTIFIDRNNRRETLRLAHTVHERMSAGETVAVFPEGTTSDGNDVLRFSAGMLEPVVAAGGEVWAVAIRYYRNEAGKERRTCAAAYIGDMSLFDSLRAIFREAPLVVEVSFVEAIDCNGKTRREVSQQAEAAIRSVVRSDIIV